MYFFFIIRLQSTFKVVTINNFYPILMSIVGYLVDNFFLITIAAIPYFNHRHRQIPFCQIRSINTIDIRRRRVPQCVTNAKTYITSSINIYRQQVDLCKRSSTLSSRVRTTYSDKLRKLLKVYYTIRMTRGQIP